MPSQTVAIKICRNGIYKEEDLENEIRLLSQCSHENIIIFLGYYYADFGLQSNVIHIVTEFMDGGTLEDFCMKEVEFLFKKNKLSSMNFCRKFCYENFWKFLLKFVMECHIWPK
jgi:serine/threonine protein kinase